MEKKLVTIKEAAKMLGVSPLTLRNWDRNGKFKAMRHPINNYRVYKLEVIDNLNQAIETNTPADNAVKKNPCIKKLKIKHLDR